MSSKETRKSEQAPGVLRKYQKPEILFRERLESVAAVCSGESAKTPQEIPPGGTCTSPLRS